MADKKFGRTQDKIKAIKILPEFVLIPFLLAAISAPAQNPEVATKESAVTFRSGINLVSVPVIVRDSKGNPVDNLPLDDFQLSDNGKPQIISKFSIERAATHAATNSNTAPSSTRPGPGVIPTRFVAHLFDDVHMQLSDLVYTRDAVARLVDTASDPAEHIAIYTTSGRPMQEFTSDKAKLHAALSTLRIGQDGALAAIAEQICPPMTYYMGDLIYNQQDPAAIKVAITDAINCGHPYSGPSDLRARAREALMNGDVATRDSLDAVRNVIARLASMPGERSAVVISPGFLVLNDFRDQQSELIERAIRQNVIISGLDSRGVFTVSPEAADAVNNAETIPEKQRYSRMEALTLSDVMASLADGTGGTFYQGSNDMNEGVDRTSAAPAIMYLLSFSPLDLKSDGKLHHLKVTLKSPHGLDLQFRKSYYAPKAAADPAERAKQQLEEAFFSRDEVHDLPAALETQFFRSPNGDATIFTVAKLDVKNLNFRRENDRNLDNVTVVTGLFDADGNFMTGIRKIVELRLLDQTIHTRLAGGLGVKTTFPAHAGKYIVRMAARDSEGGLLAAQSALVEIP